MYLSGLLPTNPSVRDSRDMSFGMKSAPDSLLSSIFRSRELSFGSILWVSRGNTDSQICRWYSSLTCSNASPFPCPYYDWNYSFHIRCGPFLPSYGSYLGSIPGIFRQSVYHLTESLFIPVCASRNRFFPQLNNDQAFFLTISTILSGMQEYGVPSTGL